MVALLDQINHENHTVYTTPGIQALMEQRNESANKYLDLHFSDQWGDLTPDDIQANVEALEDGALRVFSSYKLEGEEVKVWVITEADRESTTVLLPEEY